MSLPSVVVSDLQTASDFHKPVGGRIQQPYTWTPVGRNDERYLLLEDVDFNTTALLSVNMFKSTDRGATWAQVSGGLIGGTDLPGGSLSDWTYGPPANRLIVGDTIYWCYTDPSYNLRMVSFDISSGGAWGTPTAAGPLVWAYYATNTASERNKFRIWTMARASVLTAVWANQPGPSTSNADQVAVINWVDYSGGSWGTHHSFTIPTPKKGNTNLDPIAGITVDGSGNIHLMLQLFDTTLFQIILQHWIIDIGNSMTYQADVINYFTYLTPNGHFINSQFPLPDLQFVAPNKLYFGGSSNASGTDLPLSFATFEGTLTGSTWSWVIDQTLPDPVFDLTVPSRMEAQGDFLCFSPGTPILNALDYVNSEGSPFATGNKSDRFYRTVTNKTAVLTAQQFFYTPPNDYDNGWTMDEEDHGARPLNNHGALVTPNDGFGNDLMGLVWGETPYTFNNPIFNRVMYAELPFASTTVYPAGTGPAFAAFTFDFAHGYFCTRDNAAPGSGTWTTTGMYFDGTGAGVVRSAPNAQTFSCGGLTATDDFGIISDNESAGDTTVTRYRLQYLGNGLEHPPVRILYPGGSSFPFSSDNWDIHQGAYTSGGNKFIALESGPGGIDVIMSSDGGATWAVQDTANSPPGTNSQNTAMQRVGDSLFFFTDTGSSAIIFAIYQFNMLSMTWQPSFATLNTSSWPASPIVGGINDWSNALYKFANGDFGLLYGNGTYGCAFRLWSGGVWGPEIIVSSSAGGAYANSVLDPNTETIHVLEYETNNKTAAVKYHTVTHHGVVTSNIFTFPIATGGSDGVGHPVITNGMLFVPRDYWVDFNNAVFVGTLPVTSFSKELLPVPPGETNEINNATLNSGGSGYALGDTGYVNGGVFQAVYQVLALAGSAVAGFTFLFRGGDYSTGTNITTTPGGPQPGSGSGFTIDINSVLHKDPSCAYMMLANGYVLAVAANYVSMGGDAGGGLVSAGKYVV